MEKDNVVITELAFPFVFRKLTQDYFILVIEKQRGWLKLWICFMHTIIELVIPDCF